MVFGINKKRESWSSRPLSMILPENVKLFSKKSRGMIEKASQDYSGRTIEGQKNQSGAPSPANTENTHTPSSGRPAVNRESPASPIHYKDEKRNISNPAFNSQQHDRHTANRNQAQIPEEAEQDLGSPSQSIAETSSHSVGKDDNAPFLTLDLDDTESSLQDLTDHLSELDVNTSLPPKIPPVAPARAARSKRDSVLYLPVSDMEQLRSLDNSQNGSSKEDTSASTTSGVTSPIGENKWNDSSDTLLLSQMKAANRAATELGAEDGPVESAERDVSEDHSDKLTDEHSSDPTVNSHKIPELDPEQHDSSSGDSAGTAISDGVAESEGPEYNSKDSSRNEQENAYLLNPSVKVMINRGVYIFDPSDGQDCLRSMKLSDDESFNPFAFE